MLDAGSLAGAGAVLFILIASARNLSAGGPSADVGDGDRLIRALAKSRSLIGSAIESLHRRSDSHRERLEEVEKILYEADIGPGLVGEFASLVRRQPPPDGEALRERLYAFLEGKMRPVQEGAVSLSASRCRHRPEVVMVVGVNGAGKTTTVGKLAAQLTGVGTGVVVGACDTFRAAAVSQLRVWCDRSGARMVEGKEGAGPSGVGYEALKKAIDEGADYCLLDTAGRLHTAEGLMRELVKGKNVLAKLLPGAPHRIFLVIDAIVGQNALRQAWEFHRALGLTGLIFTKCDGSAKAGSAVGIVDSLRVPVSYVGVGEGVEDLEAFCLNGYLSGLLGSGSLHG